MKRIILFAVLLAAAHLGLHATAGVSLEEYTGKYVFSSGSGASEAVIEVKGQSLQIHSKAGKATLNHTEKDVFDMVEYDGTVEFKRDESGKIISVKLKLGILDVEGVRDGNSVYWWRHNMLFKKASYNTLND